MAEEARTVWADAFRRGGIWRFCVIIGRMVAGT